MFQFPGLAHLTVGPCSRIAGFPHSEIPGSKRVCRSPGLIAAYRVLHRLRVPRHPLRAFSRLTTYPSSRARATSNECGHHLAVTPALLWFGFASFRDHYPLLLSNSMWPPGTPKRPMGLYENRDEREKYETATTRPLSAPRRAVLECPLRR
jgi:hypothetical protein